MYFKVGDISFNFDLTRSNQLVNIFGKNKFKKEGYHYVAIDYNQAERIENIESWSQKLSEEQHWLYQHILCYVNQSYYAIFKNGEDTGIRFTYFNSSSENAHNKAFNIKSNTTFNQSISEGFFSKGNIDSFASGLVYSDEKDWDYFVKDFSFEEKIERAVNTIEVEYLVRERLLKGKFKHLVKGLTLNEIIDKRGQFLTEIQNNKYSCHLFENYDSYTMLAMAVEYNRIPYEIIKHESIYKGITEEEWTNTIENTLIALWFKGLEKIVVPAKTKIDSFANLQ